MNTKVKWFAIVTSLVLLLASFSVSAQKTTQWSEWSKKEAEKILNDSPWSQTQTETNTSEMFYSPTTDPRLSGVRSTSNTESRISQGATNQSINVKYYIRFFSARPVRQALVRMMMLNQKFDAQTTDKLRNFAEFKSTDSIILTVTFESNDQRFSGQAMQAFNSAVIGTLKNNTYLERNDGKRLFLEEYVPPGKDGFGSRFIFLRALDGKDFITGDAKEVRFYSEVSKDIKLDKRFKLSDMIYQGQLEY